jgi:3-deoxy-manno-octulosonate cytidylyltransferase (CMP-KDO synthetase)
MPATPPIHNQKTVGIIPARLGSEEVHAKVLIELDGKPVIQHVYERALASKRLDRILIAADHPSILEVARDFGAEVYLTRLDHICGTDRCAETARALCPEADLIVNIQADEPFFHPQMIGQVLEPLSGGTDWDMTTICSPFQNEEAKRFSFNVKIARSSRTSRALYFSRAVIPFPRTSHPTDYYQHIGIYGYRMSALERFARFGPSDLELIEGLEQLRALEADLRIKAIATELDYPGISIDTQADIAQARQWLRQQPR